MFQLLYAYGTDGYSTETSRHFPWSLHGVFCWICIGFENNMSVQANLLYRNISHEPRGVSGVFVSERHMTHKERFPMCVKFCCSGRPSGKSVTSTAQSELTESLRGGWYKGQQFFLNGLGKEEKISCFSTGHWISSNLAVNEKELRSNGKAESVILFWKNYVILCLIWLWN